MSLPKSISSKIKGTKRATLLFRIRKRDMKGGSSRKTKFDDIEFKK